MAKAEKITAADLLSGGKKKSEKKGGKKKGGKHGFHKTEIEHHPDGSHTVRHLSQAGGDGDTSYAAADLDGVKAGMDEHLGGGPEAAEGAEPEAGGAGPSGLPPAPSAA